MHVGFACVFLCDECVCACVYQPLSSEGDSEEDGRCVKYGGDVFHKRRVQETPVVRHPVPVAGTNIGNKHEAKVELDPLEIHWKKVAKKSLGLGRRHHNFGLARPSEVNT